MPTEAPKPAPDAVIQAVKEDDFPVRMFSPVWEDFFPESSARDAQVVVLNSVAEALQDPTIRNIVLELPTGVGKSAIAVCIANIVAVGDGKTYITTASKQLQEVYERSYADKCGVKKIFSAENFECLSYKGKTCNEGGSMKCDCRKEGNMKCPYKLKKAEFVAAPKGIVNLPYLLTENAYVGELSKRDVLIIDECHTAFKVVQDFATVEITNTWLEKIGVPESQRLRSPEPCQIPLVDAITWLNDVLLPKIDKDIVDIQTLVQLYEQQGAMELLAENTKKRDELIMARRRIDRCFESVIKNSDDWVSEITKTGLRVAPIYSKEFAAKFMDALAVRRIFTSATIGHMETFVEDMGLDPKETVTMSMPSPFPVENRIIRFMDCGKLEFRNLAGTMRPFAEKIKEILAEHKGQRGIILVSSYDQARELIRQVGSSRLITHADSASKESMLRMHEGSKDSVIVSPSMHEGWDGKDDLSRFQVLLKMPFPSLGDAAVKTRMERDDRWYANLVAQKLMQFSGRSVRSETDYAATYILDGAFKSWYHRWKKIIPQYWKDAVRMS